MDDETFFISDQVPVFPLPEVVLFPRTILPLHVFEPRYREMTADALIGDRTVAVALLKPGFEPLYYTREAPIHTMLGVGQIVESETDGEGNYNVLLRGVGRARIIEELTDRSYRLARVEPVPTFCSQAEAQAHSLRGGLLDAIRGNPGLDPNLRRQWLRLGQAGLELDGLADLIGAGLPVEAELRQCLLDEADAYARGNLLLDQIQTLASVARTRWRASSPDAQNMN